MSDDQTQLLIIKSIRKGMLDELIDDDVIDLFVGEEVLKEINERREILNG